MSQELFYTSAPRGLQPGSRGFCTVAVTRGMSPALMEKLESLSGYRPLYPPSDSRYSLNPVTYAHVKIGVGGKSYHVLSRIGAAGLDYTERANKFAHHVVLEGDELPAAGPAWVLNQPGFMENRWNGAVQYLAEGRIPPRGDSQPEICRAWKEASGDPGWAGIVAEAFLQDSHQLVYLLFEPGLNLLPLIAEAVALLRAEQRWDVTFSTYFTGLSQGAICAWRCVPRDSVEANAAGKIPNALILDLGIPLGPARGGHLVAKARGQTEPPPVPSKTGVFAGEGDRERFYSTDRIGSGVPLPELKLDRHGAPPMVRSGGAPNLPENSPGLAFPPPFPPFSSPPREKKLKTSLAGLGIGAISGGAIMLALVAAILMIWGPKQLDFFGKENAETKNDLTLNKEKNDHNNPNAKELQDQLTKSRKMNENLEIENTNLKEKNATILKKIITSQINEEELVQELRELQGKVDNLDNQLRDLLIDLKNGNNIAVKVDKPIEAISLVQKDFFLPGPGNPKDDDKIGLPSDTSEFHLSLRGLKKDVNANFNLVPEFKEGELVIFLKKNDLAKFAFARFKLKDKTLHFSWEKEEKLKEEKVDLSYARRLIRNSVLQIEGPGLKEPMFVGLIFPGNKLKDPWSFDFSNNPVQSRQLDFEQNKEFLPLNKLLLASAKCEIKTETLRTELIDQKHNLKGRDDQIGLQLINKPDFVSLEAEWKGKRKPAPILYVKHFVLYMIVDGLNVKFFSFGKE